ncbi:MAG: hypothetical protein SCH98_17520 [Deferrisomatales bacterium]|nr:hypothetical protein [Deferrisomatales bacterium]
MHKIDPLNVDELVAYVFDIQHGGSVDLFREAFSEPIQEICGSVKECYLGFLQFEKHEAPDERFLHLTAHIYALVEALYTSVKLLAHGFLAPSGNQFRVALEAMAVSVLLSHPGDLLLEKRPNKWVSRSFYADFAKDKRWTLPHLAIKTLDKNREQIGLSEQAMKLLSATKDIYNKYSHSSRLSIRAIVVAPDRVLFGGGYEHEQEPLFAKELEIRSGFIEKVPSFLTTLYKRVA